MVFKEFGYSMKIDDKNLIVKDHIVHGSKVMPGIVLLDMCINILISEKIDYKTVEFRNILFKTPIELETCKERELIISLENKDNKSLINGKSRAINTGYSKSIESYTEHFECEIHSVDFIESDNLGVSYELSQNTEAVEDMDNAYKFVRNVGIEHKPFMKAEGKVYCFKDKLISHSVISQEANAYKNRFFHQPSILDSSTILPYLAIRSNNSLKVDNKAFIPIHIQSFRAFKPIGSEAYIYIENKDVYVANSGDITYASWKIYDEKGQLAAEVTRLSSKQIREVGMATESITKDISHSTETKPNTKDSHKNIQSKEKQSITLDISGVENYIIEKIHEQMKVEITEEDYEKGFYEIGLNSRDLIFIVKRIENDLDIKLYPTIMFEYANIKELSTYLYSEYKKQFNEWSEKNPTYIENQSIIQNENIDAPSEYISELSAFQTKWIRSEENNEYSESFDWDLVILFTNDIEVYANARKQYKNVVQIVSKEWYEEISDTEFQINPFRKEHLEKVLSKIVPNKKNIAIINMFDFEILKDYTVKYPEQIVYNFNLLVCKGLMKYANSSTQYKILNLAYHKNINNCYTSALAGFYKCLLAEKAGIKVSIITCDFKNEEYNSNKVWRLLQSEINIGNLPLLEVRYVDYVRLKKAIYPVDFMNKQSSIFNNEGVYVITGGMGKILKSLVSKVSQQYKCIIILLGRRNLTDEMQAWLKVVNKNKAEVVYDVVDICNEEDTCTEIQRIIEKYHKITGIIHGAGVVEDAMIVSKDAIIDKADSPIASKICGLNNLDKAIGLHKIEFMLLFSSISAVFGNLGQSNYAYGNSYMDNYADIRNSVIAKNKKHGRILSINWPLWESGGMDLGYDYEHIFNHTGIEKINHEIGFDMLVKANHVESSQVIMLRGIKEKIFKYIANHYDISIEEDTSKDSIGIVQRSSKDIAIIGISSQFPMADNIHELWKNLKGGRDCIETVPTSRWTKEDITAILGDNSLNVCNYGGFLKEINQFDTRLFNITPVEAKMMDPQERLFLSTVWTTLEDAGYSKEQLTNKDIGVFVGVMWGQYQMFQTTLNDRVALPTSIYASVANRVSYYYNWHGPSLTIDTMCSSSMTAIKLACESINNNGVSMAIAGGVNLSIHPAKYIVLAQNNFTAEDGRCKSFGEDGKGYVPGEGTGAILLKRLDKAIEDGDYIYGVIKACEINHGGKTSGYSVPSVQYQSQVIEKALKSANMSAADISYIEAHGTGTELGDPIEIKALQNVFNKYTSKKQFCSIGSIKSNIGHLEAASSIAGIIKVLLQMKYKKLVPSLHSQKTNPNINFEETSFYCQQEYSDWNSEGPRCAGISSFGAGGSNAHIIIQEYNHKNIIDTKRSKHTPRLFTFSAYNQEILFKYIDRHKKYLDSIYTNLWEKDNITRTSETNLLQNLEDILIDFFEFNSKKSIDEILLDEINFDLYKGVNFQKVLKKNGIQAPEIEQLIICESISDLKIIIMNLNKLDDKMITPYDNELAIYEEAIFLDSYEYTLQVGRVCMKKRLAVVASSVKELVGYLEMFLQHKTHPNILYKQSHEADNTFFNMFSGIEGINFIKALIKNNNLINVGKMWAEGMNLDWNKLMDMDGRNRITIPTYPFADEKIVPAHISIPNHGEPAYDKTEDNEETAQKDFDMYEIIKSVKTGVMTVNNAIGLLKKGEFE